MAALELTREQVLAYRVAAQGLHRDTHRVEQLAVLRLGVQEAMGHPAALAFAARLPAGTEPAPGDGAALAWTFRGAPHVHPRDDLDAVAAALWPLSEADATARLNETGPSVARAGITALEQFGLTVDAVAAVVTEPMSKGVASRLVTERLPEPLRRACRPCGTSHVSDSALRAAAPAAGVQLRPDTGPPVLVPRADAVRPVGPDVAALGRWATAYLALLGPAGPKEFAGYLEARRADVEAAWPSAGLVPVRVDGRAAWLPERTVEAARSAPAPELVRLLGPFDPYLQARDRDLIVPDRAAAKALWPVLGRPGAVLVDGEILGSWRPRLAGRRLTLTVQEFAPLPPRTWASLEEEARSVARARGADDARVVRAG